MFWRKKPTPEPVEATTHTGFFSTDATGLATRGDRAAILSQSIQVSMPAVMSAMDSAGDSMKLQGMVGRSGMPDAQYYWYASQGFIGYQACAILAQHWLIDKACLMPARDAVRQGYDITSNGGEGLSPEVIEAIRAADKRHNIARVMREFIHMGRVNGIRVAIFKVKSTDPEYYEKPFNIDGVTPGSYMGISQVDPIWCQPILTDAALSDPANMRFYEPEFYQIGNTRYHRSHLAIYIPHPVSDALKPSYQYGGVSVPQRIYERVYAAERTANEAPQLAMSKRLTVLKVNMAAAMSDIIRFKNTLAEWCGLRDNYGVKVIDKEGEDLTQFDSALGDLDATIMTQYQLVAAQANVPATKLLGTTPKGFNATGEYEESSYREELESVQADLLPMLERHHSMSMRSEVAPRMGIEPVETTVSWLPLDSPTAAEWAGINKTKAETDSLLYNAGAIDGMDIRKRITADKDSDHFGLAEIDDSLEPEADAPETPAINEQA